MTNTKPTTIRLTNTNEGTLVRVNQCQRRWEDLQALGHASVKFCDQCHQEVHQVIDADGFERAVTQGRCVMVAGLDETNEATRLVIGQPDEVRYGAFKSPPVQDD